MPTTARRATELGQLTWPEAAALRPTAVVPIGSCEQHGPHLPLDTDTRIAVAVAEAFAAASTAAGEHVVVTPPIAIGASGEHASFAGTLSVGVAVLEAMLTEIGRSADWSSGLVFVNGHGGNLTAVRAAVRTLTAEGRSALGWWPRIPDGDAHAGRSETSMMLAIAPALVRLERAEAGNTEAITALLPTLRSSGVAAVSANGVLGDPTGASAAEGRGLLADLVTDLADAVTVWRSS